MESFKMDAEFLLSSLLGEDSWLDDLSNQDGGKSAIKAQQAEATMATDLFRELEEDSLIGDATNPLPEWMSEKVSLTSWLDMADVKSSELLMESSLPLAPGKMDLVAPTTTAVIPPEELFDTLFVDTRYAPQPPSPGEAQAPDLVALSPASSLLPDDDSCTSSPIASPSSPVEVECQWLDPVAQNVGAMSLTTIDLSKLIQAVSPSAPCTSNGFVPMSIESSKAEVPLPMESSQVEETIISELPVPSKPKAKSKLKSVLNPVIRKTKKRDQNKKAATRYRHKKRTEQEVLEEERDGLEKTNNELNDKVDSISREIKYLKDLLAEVYKVKGEIKVMTKK